MKNFAAVCLSIGIALQATSQAHADPTLECDIANDNQVEIRNCVGAMGEVVDTTVELALGFAMESAKELDTATGRDVASKALTASQKAWNGYRDAQCEYVGSTYGGGSGTGIAIAACRIDLGRQRVSALMSGLNRTQFRLRRKNN